MVACEPWGSALVGVKLGERMGQLGGEACAERSQGLASADGSEAGLF